MLGGGAWLRRAGSEPVRLHCNRQVQLGQALVATGFGYDARRRACRARCSARCCPRFATSGAADHARSILCALAAGHVDAYYERGVNYWDIAAGGLIAREAGGSGLRPARQSAAEPDLTLAAGPGLFGDLHDLLASLNPERDG